MPEEIWAGRSGRSSSGGRRRWAVADPGALRLSRLRAISAARPSRWGGLSS